MQIVGLAGVSFGGVSRRRDGGAQGRSIYQMGFDFSDGVPSPKVRAGKSTEHKKHWLMLPAGVPPSVWTRVEIWRLASAAERRRDAREGRFFDISWPRELPVEEIGVAVAALYQPFVDIGLAVQADWERAIASDGLFNDHLHGLISTRVLTDDGFAPRKCREVDAWFLGNVRAHVAEVLNGIAETRGVDVSSIRGRTPSARGHCRQRSDCRDGHCGDSRPRQRRHARDVTNSVGRDAGTRRSRMRSLPLKGALSSAGPRSKPPSIRCRC